jgi:hypothetical protein
LVLLARHTTLAGLPNASSYFTTTAIDVTPYVTAIVTVWRGVVLGLNATSGTAPAPPTFQIWFEESTDQVVWSTCGGSPNGGDPGTASSAGSYHYDPGQHQYSIVLNKRWFRLKVQLYSATNVASCYAVGFLERRLP